MLTERDLLDAIDDLWLCIGRSGRDALDPKTVAIATAVHERNWHPHEVFKSPTPSMPQTTAEESLAMGDDSTSGWHPGYIPPSAEETQK